MQLLQAYLQVFRYYYTVDCELQLINSTLRVAKQQRWKQNKASCKSRVAWATWMGAAKSVRVLPGLQNAQKTKVVTALIQIHRWGEQRLDQ